MLYIQITTFFFGSQREFKTSCLRCNCQAARKMRVQLFSSQKKHQFCPVDGSCQARCVPVPGLGDPGVQAGLA